MRVLIAPAALFNIVTGALALVSPGTFFDDVGRYGIENSHYVGDVGAFTLAAGIGLAMTIWRPSWREPVLTIGAVWFALHALNHLFDIGEARSDARGIADTALLALGAIGSLYLARESRRGAPEPPAPAR